MNVYATDVLGKTHIVRNTTLADVRYDFIGYGTKASVHFTDDEGHLVNPAHIVEYWEGDRPDE